MLNIIRNLLLTIINNIDSGNSKITEEEGILAIEYLRSLTDKGKRLSKYQAYQYLNISRATFDNYVRAGLIPKGKRQIGFKELSWEQKDLDSAIKQIKKNKDRNYGRDY